MSRGPLLRVAVRGKALESVQLLQYVALCTAVSPSIRYVVVGSEGHDDVGNYSFQYAYAHCVA